MALHKEGKSTLTKAAILIIIIAAIACFTLKTWGLLIIIPLLILFGFMLWFFRNPQRHFQEQVENVVAPVDGKVVMIKEVFEDEVVKEKRIQVSIFMSPLNVHVCRYPVTGKVNYAQYHKGKYLVAWHEKSSTENERTTVAVQTQTHHQIVFRQIAGYVARRIKMYCNLGDQAKAGHEFGFIKFGSRMDVFLPLDTEILCKIGDKTKGGLDVIARLKQ